MSPMRASISRISRRADRHRARRRKTPTQDIDTLGGLVVSLLGRVPQRGEIVTHPAGYEFEVLEADPRRVKRLRIRAARAAAPSTAVRRTRSRRDVGTCRALGDFVRAAVAAGARCLCGVCSPARSLRSAFAPFELFPLSAAGLCGARSCCSTARRADGAADPQRGVDRLGVRLRPVPRRAALDRLSPSWSIRSAHAWQIPFVALLFPGGLALFIAAAAVRGAVFLDARVRRASSSSPRAYARRRMAARTCAHRLSLESRRLWLGRVARRCCRARRCSAPMA